jgi:hypothetical protein
MLPFPAFLHGSCLARPLRGLVVLAGLMAGLSGGVGVSPAQASECLTGRDGQMRCPPSDSRCVLDRYGEVVCAPSGGGVLTDRYGDPVCGAGRCTKDLRGDTFCSRVPRGAAAVDRYGDAVCTEGCQPARAAACVRPVPGRP